MSFGDPSKQPPIEIGNVDLLFIYFCIYFFKGTNDAVLLFLSPTSFFPLPHDPLPFPVCTSTLISSLSNPKHPMASAPSPPRRSVCKVGFYRSLLDSLACSKCPPHSAARQTGATACTCEDGYYKIDSDPPNMACTREDLYLHSLTSDFMFRVLGLF